MKTRVFLAGATGAPGRRLLPKLIEAGVAVTGTTRSADNVAMIEATGARGMILDGLEAASVARAVSEARPDVVIHELTSLSKMGGNPRKFDQDFAITNRLRTEGTDHLLAAAVAAGAKRFIVQSYAGWPMHAPEAWSRTRTIRSIPHLPRRRSARSRRSVTWNEP